jgi:polyhydroxyalkanoate synthesis regulator phasin
MPARSVIEQLPSSVREWLEAELLRRGFAGYRELVDDLQAKLTELGIDATVSKSAVHRYGQDIEERIASLRKVTQVATTIARELGDDEGAMNEATIRLVQDRLFTLMIESGQQLDVKVLSQIGHVVSDLSRASVTQKKWMDSVRAKVAEAEKAITETVREAGLSEDHLNFIRSKMLGIVS